MNRVLLLHLLACGMVAQPSNESQLYIDISDGWTVVSPSSNNPVNLGFTDSPRLTPVNQARAIHRTVDLPAWADRSRLALTLGPVRQSYTLFVNGQKIARVGSGNLATANLPQIRTFFLPASAVGPSGPFDISINLDVRATQPLWWITRGYSPSLITYRSNAPLSAGEHEMALRRLRLTPCLVLSVVFLLLALQVSLAWVREHDRPELLWFAASLLLAAFYDYRNFSMLTLHSTPWTAANAAAWTTSTRTFQFAASASFVISALHFRLRWLHGAIWFVAIAFSAYLFSASQFLPYTPFMLYRFCGTSFWLAATVVSLAGWRRAFQQKTPRNTHLFAGLLLLNSLHGALASGVNMMSLPVASVLEVTLVGGYFIFLYDVFTLVLATSILALLLRQIAGDRRQRMRLANEMNAARSAQRFLLGESQPIDSGEWVVDPVYQPATEVGGDFYQIQPLPDGALLVAVGDVSGKGLKAAMVVSMLTGLVRSHATLSPAALLGRINLSITGHLDGGFVTCAALRIEKDGRAAAANAGHPAIYCDGREMAVEPGLPLGIDPDTSYAETSLIASTFTLVSDGVIEASNPQGELFGFDRTAAISTRPAAEIAEAARAWGQNDDITVVTIRRPA